MKERVVEVSTEFFKQLGDVLEDDEHTISQEHADSHGNSFVLWTQDHKRLVFVRKRASNIGTGE